MEVLELYVLINEGRDQVVSLRNENNKEFVWPHEIGIPLT